MKKSKEQKHWVIVARPLIQRVIVDVSASSYEEASEKALEKASKFPERMWEGRFSSKDYGYDVWATVSKDHLEEEESPEETLNHVIGHRRYLLLKADIDSGEGIATPQPWIRECSPLMVADLSQDWLNDLEEIRDEGVEEFNGWLEEFYKEEKRKRSSNVVSFIP